MLAKGSVLQAGLFSGNTTDYIAYIALSSGHTNYFVTFFQGDPENAKL